MSILGLIPVSGSDPEFAAGRRRQLGTRALMDYTIAAARSSQLLDRVIVSTDSPPVAEQARLAGVQAPFLRDRDLGNPTAPVTHVVEHALRWLEEHEQYSPDWVVLLMVTYPFRPARFVDEFITTVLGESLDSAFAAVEDRHPFWLLNAAHEPELVSFGVDTAKADKRPLYRELSGLITMTRREVALQGRLHGTKVGLIPVRDSWPMINVHDPGGWQLAERLAPMFVSAQP